MDVSGVPRKPCASSSVLACCSIAGEKAPADARPEPNFHLVERGFGRFARAVRLSGAFEIGRPGQTLERRVDDRPSQARRSPRSACNDSDSRRDTRATGMNILFIGDIVGRPGRDLCEGTARAHRSSRHRFHDRERRELRRGFRRDEATSATTLLEWGVDVMTSGNHIWDKQEVARYIASEPRLLRPANYPAGVPGRGSYLAQTRRRRAVGVVNVMGRVFMTPIDDPFAGVLREIEACAARRASSSWTSTRRRPARKSRWAGISTGR